MHQRREKGEDRDRVQRPEERAPGDDQAHEELSKILQQDKSIAAESYLGFM